MRNVAPRVFLSLFACGLIAPACGTETGDEPGENNVAEEVQCEGPKCDGLSSKFKDAFSDMKNVDLSDLRVLGVGLASDELNDELGGLDYLSLKIADTSLYGAREEVLGQTIVHPLAELRSGLTERFGETAFATRVVQMRQDHSNQTNAIWAESHFAIGPNLRHNWVADHGDSDAVGVLGFNAASQIETIIIAPYEERREALIDSPLAAAKETRGWVIPRDQNDVMSMAPGESVAMRADGALGMNLGVGVPFLVGTVGSTVALNARLSFGARVAVSGELDVQLVRGTGNDVWVDVGIDKQNLRHFSVALTTSFGVEGLPEAELDLGVVDLDVDDIAERALQKQLNKHVILPRLSATTTRETARLTVARFRFDASQLHDIDAQQALHQAMRGDIRLAQALANRGALGIVQELDLTKDARSEANYVGFEFLGMEFYRASSFDTGTIHIEGDGEGQTLLFSELEEKSGFFFTDREWEWRKLVSLKTRDGVLTDADVNSRMTVREKDSFLSRDQMLDHVDPLAGYFIGYDPLWNDVSSKTDELGFIVDRLCDAPAPDAPRSEHDAFDACMAGIPTHPDVVSRETAIRGAIDTALSDHLRMGLDPAVAPPADIARELLEFKLLLAMTNDRPDVGFFGPKGKMITQVRFSDEALHSMMTIGRHEDFRATSEQILRLMAAKRIADMADKQDRVDDYIDDRAKRLDEIADLYANATLQWADLQDIADVSFAGEQVGDYGHVVLIPPNNPDNLDLASIAEHKGKILEELIPEMVDLAEKGIFRDLDEPEEFVIAYSLMWMADPAGVELLANYVFEDEDDFGLHDLDVYGRGPAPMIEAGQFNLDELLGAE